MALLSKPLITHITGEWALPTMYALFRKATLLTEYFITHNTSIRTPTTVT
jgi:hypothetical protein